MKIAVIGGGGVRTPLLVNGLAQSDVPIDEIALFDVDAARLAAIAPLARAMCPAVRAYRDAPSAVAGAAFVVVSIRVGGIAARARDEAIAMAHGVVGQETVGPGGFAMAMRTIPQAVECARLVERHAPAAWIINFTNPVGIVTQAMGGARTIGICDTPTELFEQTAHALNVDPSRCFFDYFGLNHLGWLREVYCGGVPQLQKLWNDAERLASIYRVPLFDRTLLQALRLLPTEYLFYYYQPQRALENLRKAGRTRGGAIASLNERLFRELAAAGADRRAVYERYLAERSGGYMQLEAGADARLKPRAPDDHAPGDGARGFSRASLTGYDRIALSVVRAIHFDTNAIIPLNVRNRGAIRNLEDDDVVEVPCVVNANGAHPLTVGVVPASVRDLLLQVKDYERLTIAAAATRTSDDAVRALARNPLVRGDALARRLVAALQPW